MCLPTGNIATAIAKSAAFPPLPGEATRQI
jgi:hypothetical protein